MSERPWSDEPAAERPAPDDPAPADPAPERPAPDVADPDRARLDALLVRRRIPFREVVNFRDVGGYDTADGLQTRWRRLYRSDALYRLKGDDLVEYEALSVRAVYDLRSSDETTLHPDPMDCCAVPLESRVPRSEFSDGSFLRTASEAQERLREVYVAILDTAGPLFGELYRGLAHEDRLPAVVHCAGGKDRTGLVVALLLEWLGVDRETVLDDYELTSRSSTPERHGEIVARFVSSGMTPDAAGGLLSSPRWVMRHALDRVDASYGGVESYLRGPCGLGSDTLQSLRRLFTAPATSPG